jgi:DNA-directed RNA polymerase subunit RPC12/RpoP
MGTEYRCKVCKKPINKNHESYRGAMSADMIAAIRKDCPDFHPKHDICLECGQKYEPFSGRKRAWMRRPLG